MKRSLICFVFTIVLCLSFVLFPAAGTAAEAVGAVKQMKICRCAEYYLYRKGIDPYRTRIRFDVVALTMKKKEEESGPEIRWIPNAFAYAPYRPGKPHWRVW